MKLTDKITLTNEDCMELMARTPDNYYELAICDPPYGIERFKKNDTNGIYKSKLGNRNYNNLYPSEEYFNELFRVSKNQIIWGGNNFSLPKTEYFCIWDKGIVVDNFAECEYAYVSMGLKKPAKIFKRHVMKDVKERIHPTQKPVALYKWLLDNYTKPTDKILDTHLGSMSIAIACHDYGFELDGCELDPEYYAKGIERVQNHIKQLKLF